MPIFWVVLLFILAAVIIFLLVYLTQQFQSGLSGGLRDELAGVETRLRQNTEQFVQTANERFAHEQTKTKALLEQERQSIESHVGNMDKELLRLGELLNRFDKDSRSQFHSLQEKVTVSAVASQELRAIIGNNQLRGELGERMAEDILRAAGLEPGIHYQKNIAQETVNTRPDYTFILPDGHKLFMDVKFPLQNYSQWVQAQDKEQKARFQSDFIRDVKQRIRELKKREYVNPEEGTLDYLLLFIPSEQIFGDIHRMSPGIMDEALSQKILLAAPYSLYGVLSIVRQAYDNFHFHKNTGEILKLVDQFRQDYENFKTRFDDLGVSLDKIHEKYRDISDKSFKRMDRQVQRMDDLRKGEEQILLQ